MKKLLFIAPLLGILLPIFIIPLFFADNGNTSVPVTVVATPDKAWSYQYIGSELGIPWDITMLCDAIHAEEDGLSGIEEFNPLITALEFCIIQEDIYTLQPIVDEEGYVIGEEWKVSETILYTGSDEILEYIHRSKDSLDYKDATDIVIAINEAAEDKCTTEFLYDVTLLSNTDYTYVLHDLVGLEEETAEGIIELYEAQYLPELYGYLPPPEDFEEIDVPTITGDVTRADLARIASSLINWPYLLGAKSPYAGTPVGPLDCSGYVDWVYIQCFGIGVSAGGRVPAGVAVSGTAIQFYASDEISGSELKVGDLGFLKKPRDVKAGEYNHVGIYIGEINGKHAWIHCGGKSFGYTDRPNGRVGISVSSGSNNYNPVTGTTFEPEMKGCPFKYFRRPRFTFADDILDESPENNE